VVNLDFVLNRKKEKKVDEFGDDLKHEVISFLCIMGIIELMFNRPGTYIDNNNS